MVDGPVFIVCDCVYRSGGGWYCSNVPLEVDWARVSSAAAVIHLVSQLDGGCFVMI